MSTARPAGSLGSPKQRRHLGKRARSASRRSIVSRHELLAFLCCIRAAYPRRCPQVPILSVAGGKLSCEQCSESRMQAFAPGRSSAAQIIPAVSRLLKSGADPADLQALLEMMDIPTAIGVPSVVGQVEPSSLDFIEPFSIVGTSWLDWEVDDQDGSDEAFVDGFLAKLAVRLAVAEGAYSRFTQRLRTLAQISNNEAQISAATSMADAWDALAQAFGSVRDAVRSGLTPGEMITRLTPGIGEAWSAVEAQTVAASITLFGEDLPYSLTALALHQRSVRPSLHHLVGCLGHDFHENPASLIGAAILFGQANMSVATAMTSVMFANVVALAPVAGVRTCAPPCPHKKCTVWCTESYAGPTCTVWRRIVGGVGGPSGLYHRVCNWLVTQTETGNCCCYRSRWDAFFASGACSCWTETGGPGIVVKSTQEWDGVLGTPPGPGLPAPFTKISIGNC